MIHDIIIVTRSVLFPTKAYSQNGNIMGPNLILELFCNVACSVGSTADCTALGQLQLNKYRSLIKYKSMEMGPPMSSVQREFSVFPTGNSKTRKNWIMVRFKNCRAMRRNQQLVQFISGIKWKEGIAQMASQPNQLWLKSECGGKYSIGLSVCTVVELLNSQILR